MSSQDTSQRQIGPNRIREWLVSLDQSSIVLVLKSLFRQNREAHIARVDAVRQTAVTLSHEINNPLTVVLGNAELLLMKGDQLPEEVQARLKTIVMAGLKIRDAVTNLSSATEAKSTTYIDRIKMIDTRDASVSNQ